MAFGQKIKEIRRRKGLSQRQLGEMMGITQQTVAQYEKTIEQPKLLTVRKIAEALGVPISELVDDWHKFSGDEILRDLIYKAKSEQDLNEISQVLETLENDYRKKYPLDKRLIVGYELLNQNGKEKAVNYVEDLSKIPEYQDTEKLDEYAGFSETLNSSDQNS